MMSEEECKETFIRASQDADIAVIEGVMGMFDGVDGGDTASTAHVARILNAPVILVADVKGMSRSVHALTRGFAGFDPSVRIAGIIYNRTGSPRHREMITASATLPSFGWIPRKEEIGLKSRHLGLVMAHESDTLNAAGEILEECADMDAIIATARSAPSLAPVTGFRHAENPQVRIGVALDRAFCFYYQDNLDRLRTAGADLVFFSPLSDGLPDVSGLYFGGGYPELHLPALESSPLTRALKPVADKGMPIIAECGGLMYLAREIQSEKTFRMAGIVPADALMTKKIQALGYVKGTIAGAGSIFTPGQVITGHEFHYSQVTPDHDARYALTLSRGKGIESSRDGLIVDRVIAGYTHAYFSDTMAKEIVSSAKQFSGQ